jgi:hypothetical protein
MTTASAEPIHMWKPVRWILLALGSTVLADVMAWLPGFGGAEKLLPVQLFLPWACVASAQWRTPVFLSSVSLIQWPAYVGMLFMGSSLGYQRKTLFILPVIHLLGWGCSFAYPVIPIGFPGI